MENRSSSDYVAPCSSNALRARLAALFVSAVVAISATATPALAQTSPPPKDASKADSGGDADVAEQAYSAYTSGKFSEAIALYLKVYEATDSPAALLNVARIYDRNLNEREVAAEYYRRYVRAPQAEADLVKKVNDRLAELKREAEEKKPAPAAAAVPPQHSPSLPSKTAPKRPGPAPVREEAASGGGGRVAGIVVGSVGLASLGASGILSFLARQRNTDADAYCSGKVCTDSRGVELADEAGDFATAATVTFVSGAALLGGGLTIYILSSGDERQEDSALRVSPVVGPVGSGLNVQGAF